MAESDIMDKKTRERVQKRKELAVNKRNGVVRYLWPSHENIKDTMAALEIIWQAKREVRSE